MLNGSNGIEGFQGFARQLKVVVDQFAGTYPVLVAATEWTIIDIQEEETRMLTWESSKKARGMWLVVANSCEPQTSSDQYSTSGTARWVQ